jgi:predicted amidohydrolase
MTQNVAIVQRDIAWSDWRANKESIMALVAALASDIRDGKRPKVDVVIFSEMFTTGFVTDPERIADRDGRNISLMIDIARELDAAVVGSVVVERDKEYRNRMYFITPDAEVRWYDKRHLFSIGGEAEKFTAGDERTVVEWRGVRYLLEVCYDLRFPVWSRQRGDYDAIIYSALWPKARREVWRTLLRARAMENQAYVFGVNRIGAEPTLEYAGDTMAVDYRGDVMADCGNEATIAIVEIDMERQTAFKERFDVARDADNFIIT